MLNFRQTKYLYDFQSTWELILTSWKTLDQFVDDLICFYKYIRLNKSCGFLWILIYLVLNILSVNLIRTYFVHILLRMTVAGWIWVLLGPFIPWTHKSFFQLIFKKRFCRTPCFQKKKIQACLWTLNIPLHQNFQE